MIVLASRLLLVLLLAIPAAAQLPLPSTTPASASAAAPADTLGRSTPRGAVMGFLQAVQAGRYSEATRYLQLRGTQTESAARLARELKAVMDDGYFTSLDSLSNRPEGSLDDGLAPNQESAGSIRSEPPLAILLERVEDPQAGQVWLISQATLRRVPQVYRELSVVGVEAWLPVWMVDKEPLGVSLWKWLAGLLLFPLLAGVAWLLVQASRVPAYFWRKAKGKAEPEDTWRSTAIGPAVVLIAMMLHRVAISVLGVPVLYRYYYGIVIRMSILAVLAWLAWRLIDRFTRLALTRYQQDALPVAISLIGLGRRFLKITVVAAAIMGMLSLLGFEMKTVLAGVGIGGIAVALAAQKTLENVFGGISLIGDRVIHVGDALMLGDRVGIVEDIGLRSTRFRTLDRSELSIPNGALSQMNIDNLSRRDKFWFNPALMLRLETTSDQLMYILAELRKLLYQHPLVERESARVRLTGFDASGYRVEIFSYVLTRDVNEFFAVREDLLLRCLRLIEQGGGGLAYPSQTLYMARDSGVDRKNGERAAGEIASLRERGELPFPNFRPEDIERMRGTLPYPPEGSVQRGGAL